MTEFQKHPDDIAVDRFTAQMAADMKAKLAKKRDDGYGGWDDPDEWLQPFLSRKLREHVSKGDPINVANFAMMLHVRGERIGPGFDTATFDLAAHLRHQKEWSEATFGPGARTKGVIDHIRKELCEIEDDPADLREWVDVIILAFDGAWRAGWEAEAIIEAIVAKQRKNEARTWPDWRTADPDKAIEHDRSGEGAA